LKKIFRTEEANLFCVLKLTFETVEQIADRTGRPIEGLEDMLNTMWEKGQIMGVDFAGIKLFRMMP
jgi:electron transport complex protein RnfB